MLHPTALIRSSMLATALAMALSGCSTPQPKTEPESDLTLLPSAEQPASELATKRLEQSALEAARQQNWSQFLNLSETLWQRADTENRIAIEYAIWQTLTDAFDTPEKVEALARSNDPRMSRWAALLDALQQPELYARQALADLLKLDPDALFNRHLVPELLKKPSLHQRNLHQIAVLLPFKGKYEQVSEQIRNGLLKAYMVSSRQVELRFYDSSDLNEVRQRFRQARDEGADFIIGPLTKESIEALEGEDPRQTLVLNSVKNSAFKAFNYRSQTETLQIAQQLSYNRYQRIGILSSNSPRDTETAYELMAHWHTDSDRRAILHQYESKKLNLRKALGDLINEERSQARYNNLRWLLREKLEFFPRTRQDLQAIVLIGNEKQIAVFHPQFEFFQLELPVYATSNLTPSDLQSIKTNPDLSNVTFPTIPAVFTANALNSPLEAFGWDSFLLATKGDKLAPNLCLTEGQSGILYRDAEKDVDKKLIWAHYSDNGELRRWTPPASQTDENAVAEKDHLIQPVSEPVTPLDSDTSSTDLKPFGQNASMLNHAEVEPPVQEPKAPFIPLEEIIREAREAALEAEVQTDKPQN